MKKQPSPAYSSQRRKQQMARGVVRTEPGFRLSPEEYDCGWNCREEQKLRTPGHTGASESKEQRKSGEKDGAPGHYGQSRHTERRRERGCSPLTLRQAERKKVRHDGRQRVAHRIRCKARQGARSNIVQQES
jgi:hypothetical protein